MRWLSRKFLVTLAVIGVASWLAYEGKLDVTLATLLGTVHAAYLGSNVTQKAVAP